MPVHACGTQVKRAPAAAGRVLLVAREQRLTLRRRCFAPLTDTPKRRAAVRTYLDVLAVTPVSLVERRKKRKPHARIGLSSDYAAALRGRGICARRRFKSLPQQLTTRHGKCPMKTPPKAAQPPPPSPHPHRGLAVNSCEPMRRHGGCSEPAKIV